MADPHDESNDKSHKDDRSNQTKGSQHIGRQIILWKKKEKEWNKVSALDLQQMNCTLPDYQQKILFESDEAKSIKVWSVFQWFA